ncbi:MAG: CPBP family intramembrane metalloprotease [Candidatus Azobacteroides sp.]|nr:CPBP family intramembrane metalloprotease [Candidatus Azobacteroides sp.]
MAVLKKGFFKNTSFPFQIFMLFSFVILGISLGAYLFKGLIWVKSGFSSEIVNDLLQHINEDAQLMRQSLFFQTVCGFFFPALIFARFFSDDAKEYLAMEQGISGSVAALTILSIIFALPILNVIVYLTQQIPLPDFMKAVESQIVEWENQAQHEIEAMLITDKYLTFLINLLIVAVLAAVGEEFLFRGILQNIFGKIIKNPHAVIWTVAFIFSLVHLQFFGFFARMLLGAYLGYLLYYSKSIWLPVLAHSVNNALGVISYYSIKDPELLKKMDQVGVGPTFWVSLVSLVLFSVTFIFIIKKCKSQNFFS